MQFSERSKILHDLVVASGQPRPRNIWTADTDIEQRTADARMKIQILRRAAEYASTALEIGFGAGAGAAYLLGCNDNLKLVSCDLGDAPYADACLEQVQEWFADRVTRVKGDSTVTVPALEPQVFGLIFIDGGKDYDTVAADIANCAAFADRNTWLVVDGYANPDVAAAVKEAVKAKRIKSEITTGTQFAGHYLKPRP